MVPVRGLFAKKSYLLLLLLLFLILLLLLFNYLYWPWMNRCIFTDPIVCLKGQRYKKYNWIGKGFRLNRPQEVKAPFTGNFLYSPSGTMNYEGREVGETGVIVFENEELGMTKLYVGGIGNLRGEAAVQRPVETGEVVAEVLPKGIEFLDNFSAVEIRMPR